MWIGATIAITGNTIEAFVDPNGTAWDVLRFAASTVFVVGVLAWLTLYVRERRAERAT